MEVKTPKLPDEPCVWSGEVCGTNAIITHYFLHNRTWKWSGVKRFALRSKSSRKVHWIIKSSSSKSCVERENFDRETQRTSFKSSPSDTTNRPFKGFQTFLTL